MDKPLTLRLLVAVATVLLALGALPATAQQRPVPGQPQYVATIAPLQMILSELCAGRAGVDVLLAPGASPHTYEPRPSEIRRIEDADAFFYVADIIDGWAGKLGSVEKVEVLPLVPEELHLDMPAHGHEGHDHDGHGHAGHDHGAVTDPHFWLSPSVVRKTLPALAEKLAELDPEGAETYHANAERFAMELRKLDNELSRALAPLQGEHLLLMHPSFLYFMDEYGLKLAGVVEAVPGQEPSPRYIAELVELTRGLGLKAVFSEPQLAAGPPRTISRETGLPLYELDPLGSYSGREIDYAGLLRQNAAVLLEALGGE